MGWYGNIADGRLDVTGLIPVVGAVAEVRNEVVCAAEVFCAYASFCAMAMIPRNGIALASKCEEEVKVKKGASGAQQRISHSKETKKSGITVLDNVKGRVQEGGSFLPNFNFENALRGVKEKTKRYYGKGKCFTGDMMVDTENGPMPIRYIQKGDYVWSRNEETGEIGLKQVEEVFCTDAYTIHEIEVEGKEVIRTTAYHPFYVAEKGWVNAISLKIGDMVITAEGKAEITKTTRHRQEEPVKTYNFHVEEWTSYFVSDFHVYVHNPDGEHDEIFESLGEWRWSAVDVSGMIPVVGVQTPETKPQERTMSGGGMVAFPPKSTYAKEMKAKREFEEKEARRKLEESRKSLKNGKLDLDKITEALNKSGIDVKNPSQADKALSFPLIYNIQKNTESKQKEAKGKGKTGKEKADDALTKGKPRDKHKVEKGRSLAGKGEPNSSADLLNPNGTVKRRRYYGKDGRPEVDIDYNHTDDGTHTFPHRHIWDWNKVPPRQDSR